jgi:hypothetical protein
MKIDFNSALFAIIATIVIWFFFRLSIPQDIKIPINISIEVEGNFSIDTVTTGVFRGEGYLFLLNNKIFKDTFHIVINDYIKSENNDTITYFISKNNVINKIRTDFLNNLNIVLLDLSIDSLVFDRLNIIEKDVPIIPNYKINLSGSYNIENVKVIPSKVKILLKKTEADTINQLYTELFYIDDINKNSDTVSILTLSDQIRFKKPLNNVIVNYNIYRSYDTTFTFSYDHRNYSFNISAREPLAKNQFDIIIHNDSLILQPSALIKDKIIKINPLYYNIK